MVDFYFIVMVEGVLCLLSVIFDVNELIQLFIWLILYRSLFIFVYEMKESCIFFCFV